MVIIRLLKLPASIRGFTAVDPDGNENVYINEQLSAPEQKKTLQHELEHIRQGDFESNAPAGLLETARH